MYLEVSNLSGSWMFRSFSRSLFPSSSNHVLCHDRDPTCEISICRLVHGWLITTRKSSSPKSMSTTFSRLTLTSSMKQSFLYPHSSIRQRGKRFRSLWRERWDCWIKWWNCNILRTREPQRGLFKMDRFKRAWVNSDTLLPCLRFIYIRVIDAPRKRYRFICTTRGFSVLILMLLVNYLKFLL